MKDKTCHDCYYFKEDIVCGCHGWCSVKKEIRGHGLLGVKTGKPTDDICKDYKDREMK